jgi:hypothetical protein
MFSTLTQLGLYEVLKFGTIKMMIDYQLFVLYLYYVHMIIIICECCSCIACALLNLGDVTLEQRGYKFSKHIDSIIYSYSSWYCICVYCITPKPYLYCNNMVTNFTSALI